MQRALRRQGLSEVTRDSYARAVRRLEGWVDVPLDQVAVSQLKDYFSALIESHSWSTVKVDRCGLQFFYAHVLSVSGTGSRSCVRRASSAFRMC